MDRFARHPNKNREKNPKLDSFNPFYPEGPGDSLELSDSLNIIMI